MLKEIILSSALLMLGASNSSPVRANPLIEVCNSTDFDFDIVPTNIDVPYTVSARSFGTVSLDNYPEDGLRYEFFVTIPDTLPQFYLYAFNGLPSPYDQPMEFTLVSGNTYKAEAEFGSVYYPENMQIYTRHSLVGETYYMRTPSLDNSNNVAIDVLSVLNATATINGRSLTSLIWEKSMMSTGLMGYGTWTGNGTLIASNSRSDSPVDFNEITNVLLYREGWSNVLTFTSGYLPHAYNIQGYEPNSVLENYLSKNFVGYVTLTSSTDIVTSLVPLQTGFGIMGMVISAMNSIFTWQILPGITLGLLILVPVLVLILLFILKLVKKG